jgi:hypothetical protein
MRDIWSAEQEDMEEEEAPPGPIPFPSVSPPRRDPEPRYPGRQRQPPGEWWKVGGGKAQPARFDAVDSEEDRINSPVPEGGDGEDSNLAFRALEIVYPEYLDYNQALQHVVERALSAGTNGGEPKSFREAMTRSDWKLYLEAAEAEMRAHLENGTWTLVELPHDRKPIGSRWVFKIKHGADGQIERYKARLVAKGYAQRRGIDYNEVFAPTMRWASIRLILALAALWDWEVESLDVSNAYLNGVLPEDVAVYMEQPEGFKNEEYPNWVCRLVKGLYGMKQAGRLWYQKLGEVLEKLGFQRLVSDPSIYVWEKTGIRVILPAFVDDLTLVSKSKALIQETKTALSKAFKIRDLGPITFLLGVHITRDRSKRTLSLSQRQYVIDLLERFDMHMCKPVSTPAVPGTRLSKSSCPSSPEELAEMEGVPYMEAVGALMYLAVSTRPDIAYIVGKLSRFNSNPGKDHWLAVKHLFRYLQGTKDLKLTYAPDPSSSAPFTTYVDSDFFGDKDNGKSTNGFVVKVGTGAISWASKLQGVIARSSTEAEFYGASFAGTEIKWLRNILGELGHPVDGPSPLWVDNQSTIQVLNDAVHHSRMKHISVQEFWIRDEVSKVKSIEVHYMPTEEMPADIFTKALSPALVVKHRSFMGLS